MDFYPEETYFKETKVLLQCLGIWPFGNSTLKHMQVVIAYVILLSSLFTQFATLVVSGCNIDDFLSVLAVAIPCSAAVMKYTCFLIQAKKIRAIWEAMRWDWWKSKNDENAIRILRQYGKETRLLTLAVLSISLLATIVCTFLAVPKFLDIVIPLNQSRPKTFAFAAEYFVDIETYFYSIFIHMWLTFVIGMNTIIITEVTLLVLVQHACCMLKVTSYKLEHVVDGLAQTCLRSLDTNRIIYDRIVDTVKIYNSVIRFVEYVWETFVTSYILLILIGVFSVSISMFRFFRALNMGAGSRKLCGYCVFFLGQFAHLFLCNFFAQRLIDHSTDIFNKTCMVPWYDVSVPTQKLLLFILQRTMKKTAFVAASVFTASLEGFSTLASTSFSYFTVIYSML